jgi:hypothetical protein
MGWWVRCLCPPFFRFAIEVHAAILSSSLSSLPGVITGDVAIEPSIHYQRMAIFLPKAAPESQRKVSRIILK